MRHLIRYFSASAVLVGGFYGASQFRVSDDASPSAPVAPGLPAATAPLEPPPQQAVAPRQAPLAALIDTERKLSSPSPRDRTPTVKTAPGVAREDSTEPKTAAKPSEAPRKQPSAKPAEGVETPRATSAPPEQQNGTVRRAETEPPEDAARPGRREAASGANPGGGGPSNAVLPADSGAAGKHRSPKKPKDKPEPKAAKQETRSPEPEPSDPEPSDPDPTESEQIETEPSEPESSVLPVPELAAAPGDRFSLASKDPQDNFSSQPEMRRQADSDRPSDTNAARQDADAAAQSAADQAVEPTISAAEPIAQTDPPASATGQSPPVPQRAGHASVAGSDPAVTGENADEKRDRLPRRHLIVDGDTLPKLAARYWGDSARYLEIFRANTQLLPDPRLLPIGIKIEIPESARAMPVDSASPPVRESGDSPDQAAPPADEPAGGGGASQLEPIPPQSLPPRDPDSWHSSAR